MPSRIASDSPPITALDRPAMNSSLIATRFLSLGIAGPQRTVTLRTFGDSPLTAKGRVPRTKEVQGVLGRTEIGVIYPDLPWLMRFNSHPINADRYVIG
jgi:hypothetical protein